MAAARPYLGRGGFRAVGYLLGLAGAVAAFVGPAYAINGATQAPGYVQVVATLQPDGEALEPYVRTDVLAAEDFPEGGMLAEAFRRGEQLADDVEGLV